MPRATPAAPARPPIGRVAAVAALILICSGALPVVPARDSRLWPGSGAATAAVSNVLPIAVTVEPKRGCTRSCAKSTRIWTMRTDGRVALPVTSPSGAYDRLPRWSPDGKALAFSRTSATTGRAEVYVMRAVSGRFTSPVRVSSTATRWGGLGCEGGRMVPVWSPTSSRLAFTCRRGERSAVLVVRRDGTGQQQVASAEAWADDSPSWRPDSQWLTFTRVDTAAAFGAPHRSAIWTVPTGTRLGVPQAMVSPSTAVGQPTWAPTGRRLAYVERDERTLETRLRVVDRTTGVDRVLHRVSGTTTIYGPAWSPGGTWLAHAVGDGLGASAVRAVPAKGGSVVTLSRAGTMAFAPTWGPSGTVAFDAVSGTTTPVQQVVRSSVSKRSSTNLPVASGYTYDAHWRPTP